MISSARVLAIGLLAAGLSPAAASAGPLVLADEDMARLQTSLPLQARLDPGTAQGGQRPTLQALSGKPSPAAADAAKERGVLPAATPKRPPTGARPAERRLSNEEADLITAAGFLFPLTSVIASRMAFGEPPRVVSFARTNAPRVIIDISDF